ncbi:MAG: hypothetical protein A2044_02445 [Candidatus Firestonebacteria bacterium GWA2_43_8]|nr:MAG: hypothetical protein A2044_02445 [Candidatus Firestonebacteria bacterium GWA2_43_8]
MRAWCCKCKLNKIIIQTANFLLVLFLSSALAGVGTETMQFLKIKPSARATSLGDSFVSIANDVNATFYNPAGLAQLDTPEFSLMHMVYMADTSYEFGTLVLPVGDKIRIGAYVIYMNYGSFGKTTEDTTGVYQTGTGSYSPYDLSTAVSLGYKMTKNINIGINFKMAVSDIDGSKLNGIMGDAGILLKLSEEIGLGGVVYNLGGALTNGDSTPVIAKFGLSTKLSLAEENDLTVGVGCNYVSASSKLSESLGAEYIFQEMFVLRAGYGINSDSDSLNVGAGLRQNLGGMIGTLDYNFSLLGDMGSAHRVSIGVKFGEKGGTKSKSVNSKKKSYNSGIRNYYKR